MPRNPYSNPAVESVAREIDKAFRETFQALKTYLRNEVQTLNRQGQLVLRDRANIARIKAIVNNLKVKLRELGFDKVLTKQATGLVNLAQSVLKEAGDSDLPTALTETTGADLDSLISGAHRQILHHENAIARDIEQILLRSATGSVDWSDLVDRLELQMGVRQDQALTAANDAIQTFHTHTRVQHFAEAGVEWWLYDGPKDSRNRDFCEHFVGTRVTLKGLDSHATDYKRKHPLPPSQSLGGYNCRHELIPLVEGGALNRWTVGPR